MGRRQHAVCHGYERQIQIGVKSFGGGDPAFALPILVVFSRVSLNQLGRGREITWKHFLTDSEFFMKTPALTCLSFMIVMIGIGCLPVSS